MSPEYSLHLGIPCAIENTRSNIWCRQIVIGFEVVCLGYSEILVGDAGHWSVTPKRCVVAGRVGKYRPAPLWLTALSGSNRLAFPII
jgi:hypothetical protein